MVEEFGLAGLKMAALAKRVGVSPSTVYVYFKDKEDLVKTLFQEVTESIVGQIMGGITARGDFQENLKHAWYNFMDYLYENYPAIAFHEQVKTSPYYVELVSQMEDGAMKAPLDVIRFGKMAGEVKDIDENLLFATLGAMSIRMTQMFVRGHLERTDEILEDCFGLIRDSLLI